jgi:hypothetical protein
MQFYSHWTILLIAIFLFLNKKPSSSQLTPEQEQEFSNRLLQSLSPLCREEVINAMNNNRNDVTDDCRLEITSITQQMQQDIMAGQAEMPMDEQELVDDFGNPVYTQQKPRKRRSAPSASWIDPLTAIILFTVALFGSLAAYLFYYYKTYGFESLETKPKKLSKKKVYFN